MLVNDNNSKGKFAVEAYHHFWEFPCENPSSLLEQVAAIFKVETGKQVTLGKTILVATDEAEFTVRAMEKHILVDVVDAGSKLSDKRQAEIRSQIEKVTSEMTTPLLPPLNRGAEVCQYLNTVDGRMLHLDFDKLLFHKVSEFQDVKIFQSDALGNVLVLDNDINMSEADLTYTRAIMGDGQIEIKGKDGWLIVLILGGGDGGILHESRMAGAKSVTMLELDGAVVEGCREHLRGVCHDSLDQLKGDNYEVILGDCYPSLLKYIEEGRHFDVIVYDLTLLPVAPSEGGDADGWELFQKIVPAAIKVAGPKGHLLMQANGKNNLKPLAGLNKFLDNYEIPLNVVKNPVLIPSYYEKWMFYYISQK